MKDSLTTSDRQRFRPSRFLKCRICCLAFLGISAMPAHAYLDPGTGSIILQGLIAGLAAVAAYFSIFRSKVETFLKRVSRSAGENEFAEENEFAGENESAGEKKKDAENN